MPNRTILIVDDEDYLRLLLEQTLEDLEDEGVQLMSARNGREGLELIQRHSPQLVFLDIMMPEMTGFDVCRVISQWPESQRPVVILLTARGQEADRAEGLRLGARDYITKPFDPDAVLAVARRVLGSDRADAEAEA
jgi:two-component system, OmpR family, alkaline phosphatase synthesis response regulator PhoP